MAKEIPCVQYAVKEMCLWAGFSGDYSNHLGKVTCAAYAATYFKTLSMNSLSWGRQDIIVVPLHAWASAGSHLPNFSLPQYTQHYLSVSSVLEPPPSESVKHEPLSECWKPPPQPVSQKENSFTLPGGFVLNFYFGIVFTFEVQWVLLCWHCTNAALNGKYTASLCSHWCT